MKKKVTYYIISLLFCLAAVITGCSEEDIPTPDQGGKEEGEIVNIQITVQSEESPTLTKADIDKGVDGEDGAFWSKYDMRYIMEVWRNISDTSVVVHRDTLSRDDFGSVDFNVNLVKGTMYDFLFWADVVKQGSKDDLHYLTVASGDRFGLKSIYEQNQTINDNSCDAFTGASTNITITSGNANRSVNLSRPLAKLITNISVGDSLVFDSICINYQSVHTNYNAYTSDYLGGGNSYSIGQKATAGIITFFDYIFVKKDIRGTTPIINNDTITYSIQFYNGTQRIAEKTVTGIPIGANKKTTVNVDKGYIKKIIYKEGDLYTSPDGKYTGVVYNLVTETNNDQTFDLVYNKCWPPIYYNEAVTNINNLNTNGVTGWSMPTKTDLLLLASSIKKAEVGKYQQNISCIPVDSPYPFAAFNDDSFKSPWTAYFSSTKDNESDTKVYVIWLGISSGTKVENVQRSTISSDAEQSCAVAVHKGHTN